MKKIFLLFKKIFCGFFGIIFLLTAIGGIINCFLDFQNIKRYIPLTLVFFALGLILLKKAKSTRSKIYIDEHKRKGKESTIASNQYIQDGNTIVHTDGSPIADEEIPYLMQLGYEEALRAEKESDNPEFHRTEREEELSFNFMMKHESELCPLVDQFEYLYHAAYKTDDLSQRIELLERSLAAFEKAKKFAHSKGKGGTIYFQDMYEYMHNSQNSRYSYADIIQDSLNSAIQERDVIIPGILQIVNDNDDILQKNIYEKLPSISKSDIQREIRKLENEHVLTRTEKSNSYELHIVK